MKIPILMQGFQKLLLSRQRGFRIAKRFGWLSIRAYLPFLSNYNHRQKYTQIPQPAYYNSPKDMSIRRLIQSNFWLSDMNILYSNNQSSFNKLYQDFDYDNITRTFYPTKNNAMESVNMDLCWSNSWWNPLVKGQNRFQNYRKSDTLFADMIVNTQGVYKAKRVLKGSAIHEKVKKLFEESLSPHRKYFGSDCQGESLIDSLIEANNLYWVDYPQMRQIQNDQGVRRKIGGQKYSVNLTTSTTKSVYKGYIQIPFGIFAELPNYVPNQQKSFVCIGAVFNDSTQVYHPFDEGDQITRDKWQLAKSHFASTDNNDFIIRVHLGHLHYASAIYTTALCNLSKKRSDLAWFKKNFIDQFAYGLLQINFLANITLADHIDPIAQKTIYLRAAQSLPLIQQQNAKFNILQFCPQDLGKDSYQSTSVRLSRKYYEKLSLYIDYIFEKNRSSWQGRTQELGKFIYNQLRSGNDKFDGIPESICHDKTPESIKKILKNLAYLWLIHHGETFSIISIVNMYYFCPTFIRKPLSQFPNRALSNYEKQQWMAPKQVINDSMILSKQVTYRKDNQTVISKWGQNQIDNTLWNQLRKKHIQEKRQKKIDQGIPLDESDQYKWQDYDNFWNDVSIEANKSSMIRNQQGLFYLHWLMPNQMPNALNI